MKKTATVILTIFVVVCLAAPAWARNEARIKRGAFYLTAREGAITAADFLFTSATDPLVVDADFPLGDAMEKTLGIGFSLWDGRVGLEYTVITLEDDPAEEFAASTLMLEGAYEQPLFGPVYYYLGAGIGSVTVSMDIGGEKDEMAMIGYRFRGGLLVDLGRMMSLEVGYSYLWSGDFSLEYSEVEPVNLQGDYYGDFSSQGVTAGINIYF